MPPQGRQAVMQRQAAGTCVASTVAPTLTVRVVELLWPIKNPDSRQWCYREIVDKWLYVFENGKIKQEIFAGADGWVAWEPPGIAQANKSSAAQPICVEPYRVEIADPQAEYAFFLSPFQLDSTAVDSIKDQLPADTLDWSEGNLSDDPVPIDGQQYAHYTHSGAPERWHQQSQLQLVVRHSYQGIKEDTLYVVLLPDPYAWTEDIQLLGHLGALQVYDYYLGRARREVWIADVLSAADDKLRPDINIRGNIAGYGLSYGPAGWLGMPAWNADEIRAWIKRTKREHAPLYRLKRKHPHDPRREIVYTKVVPPDKWQALVAGLYQGSVLDLRRAMFKLEQETLTDLVHRFSTELAWWLTSACYREIELAALRMGGDALVLSLVHAELVHFRLNQTLPGQRALAAEWMDKTRLAPRLAAEVGPDFKDQWGAIYGYGIAAISLLTSFYSTIDLDHAGRVAETVARPLGGFGLKLVQVPADEIPKIFKKTPGVCFRFEVEDSSKLKSVATRFGNVEPVVSGLGTSLDLINGIVQLDNLISGQGGVADKIKAAADAASAGIGIAKLASTVPSRELKLTRVGALTGAVSSFVDAYMACAEAGQSVILNGDYDVAAFQALAAAGYVTATWAGLSILLFGEAAAGPAGWIAAGATILATLAQWIAKQLIPKQWERVANFSMYGRAYVLRQSGASEPKEYYRGLASQFGDHLERQEEALFGLMCGFVLQKFDTLNKGALRILFGHLTPKTIFEIKWQFGYGRPANRWIVIEAALKVDGDHCDWKARPVNIPRMTGKDVVLKPQLVPGGQYVFTPSVKDPYTSEYSPAVASQAYVLVNCYPLGKVRQDSGQHGVVRIPFEPNQTIDEGPLKGHQAGGYLIDLLAQDMVQDYLAV